MACLLRSSLLLSTTIVKYIADAYHLYERLEPNLQLQKL